MHAGKKRVPKRQFLGFKSLSELRGGGTLKDKDIYCFKGDIQKYFDSIDRDILKRIIRKKISSPGLL